MPQKQSNVKFRPVRGDSKQIDNLSYTDGWLYFATDTGKIYLDADEKRITMGGNSGIFYGNMTIPEDTDTGETNFSFTFDEIDGDQVPNPDDLILNLPDGGFYRVVSIDLIESIINAVKLPVSGGGGSGPGGITNILRVKDVENSITKYFTSDAEKASVKFNVSSTIIEDNYITKIRYELDGVDDIEPDLEPKDFGEIEFDFTKYLNKLSTVNRNSLKIYVEDSLGTKASIIYYIYLVELLLSSSIKDSILYTKEKTYAYYYTASGGNSLLNRKVVFTLYDAEGSKLEEQESAITSTNETRKNINFDSYEHGIYRLDVVATGQTDNGRTINSNILSYQMVNYDTEVNTLLMAVATPPRTVEQYSTIEIEYLIADDPESSTGTNIVTMNINGAETNQTIENNKIQKWRIYFDSVGEYNLLISCGDVEYELPVINVIRYTGDMPTINEADENLLLLLKTTNRSNNEVDKHVWNDRNAQGKLTNFYWGDINGWMVDEDNESMLRLTAGAKAEIENFYPFQKDAKTTGLTIELDFKVSGVLDYSKPLISCLSYNGDIIQVGFQVTGQESTMNSAEIKATGGSIKEGDDAQDQIYNTAIQGLTTKFTEDERIHLTWVIERNSSSNPLVRTYLNGVISGMTQYGKDDRFQAINNGIDPNAIIKIDSTYADIDIYNIRVYGMALGQQAVLNNYIATSGTVEERVAIYNDNNIMTDGGKISAEKVFHSSYKLSIPYLKLTGGTSLDKWKVTNETENGKLIYRLPEAKKDYRLMKLEFIDPNDPTRNFTENIQLYNEKTGEIVYSPEEATPDFVVKEGCQVYGQGTSSMEYPVKNLRIKFKENEVELYKGAYPVDLVCCKADYMESSSSHNTGTGNFVYNMYSKLGFKTPPQNFYNAQNWGYDIVTAIRGFPVAIFWSPSGENGTYEYIGKYNFNLDKATQEPFGFVSYDDGNGIKFGTTGYEEIVYENAEDFDDSILPPYVLEEGKYVEAKDFDATKTYYNRQETIHCFEFLNNASKLDNFLSDDEETFEETFYKTVTSDGKDVPNWTTAYESRYPEDSTDVDSWFEFCNWVNSTKDNPQKFKDEFNQHLDFNFTCFYYILTHILLMIDSRAKNMMIATWDNQIWYPIFYDMDTMLGLNNYGYNKFNYTAEDTEANLYNGQASILWNNFRDAFQEEIAEMYAVMRTTGGLNYNELIYNYNENQANAWNEALCNADAYYKYVRPFSEGYYNSVTGDKVWVEPGEKNYLYAGQGRRSMHRQWWLSNRLNYFDGKYLSNQYKGDRFVMRLYTPDSGAEYITDTSVTAETYLQNTHYIYTIVDGEGVYILDSSESFDKEKTYFRKAVSSDYEGITASANVVKPDNSFTLTPLHDQYLSVAYGGDNGTTTKPKLAKANVATKIENPGGAYIDTETYIYGGSMLKDLGDLSPQYLGKFVFPDKTSKLERLIIGNPHNDYYNPNFSDLSIGTKAPYLEELNIMNCNGLGGRSIDISNCRRIQKLYATGSGVTNISLPEYGILEELRLPASVQSLKLIDHIHLTNNNFTIGDCDYDAVNKIYNYTNNFSNINTINVVNTPIDTYPIIINSQYLDRITVKGFNWTITENNLEENVLKSIDVLDKITGKASATDGATLAASIVGNIHIAIPNATVNAIDIYNKYWGIFPNVTFTYDEEKMTVIPTKKVMFKDGSGEIYWQKEIQTGGALSADFFLTGPNGTFKTPTKAPSVSHNYVFQNEWIEENTGVTYTTEAIQSLTVNVDLLFAPVFSEEIKTFKIEFYNDRVLFESNTLNYGTKLSEPSSIPYKNDSELALEKTYAFKGWTDNPDKTLVMTEYELSQVIKDITSYTASRNMKFYAVFMEINVKSNILQDKYLTFYLNANKTGYLIACNSYALSGKITLPAKHNGLPIVGFYYNIIGAFQDQSAITHVFWENGATPIEISTNAFYQCSNLKYFEFPTSIKKISSNAFANCSLINNDLSWNGLEEIGQQAFSWGFATLTETKTLYLSHTITTIEGGSFNGFNTAFSNVELGSVSGASRLSKLGESPFYETISTANRIKDFIIYTEDSGKEIWQTISNQFNVQFVEVKN